MEKKREICEYRDQLDKTLSSPELTNQETLKSLLRAQLCSSQECNENILEQRTSDVFKLLTKLRSVSMANHQASRSTTNDSSSSYGDWKLKHDLEDCRVMYREGLDGSPFHTMLVEGYMDGPVQDCLCVSWESTLYKKWWPQFVFPPFRILQSKCLQRVGIGEQICLARMKVPWPLSDREVLVHYFLFEYFIDGLVVILLNTISDLDSDRVSSKDLTKNVIPESPDAVRIDLVGGFVLQKVNPQRSYFRAIADMDIKMDFVPPSLMNFITRQLLGNGFRLYKKSVASVAKFDEDYSRALADPLYIKLRRALYSTDKAIEEEPKEANGDSLPKNEHENGEDASENGHVNRRRAVPEIEEEEEEDSEEESVSSEDGNVISKTHVDMRRRFCISPDVEQALGTLDRVIYMVKSITPVQETEELSPNRTTDDHAKQVSLLEKIETAPQRSQRQDFSTSMVTEETSDFSQEEKETGQKHDILNQGKKKESFRRKRKPRCFAFRSWL